MEVEFGVLCSLPPTGTETPERVRKQRPTLRSGQAMGRGDARPALRLRSGQAKGRGDRPRSGICGTRFTIARTAIHLNILFASFLLY